ncbi:MAG: hypothetical protein ACP5OG_00115 [Candidatus Nanoarchaeia archaeon]
MEDKNTTEEQKFEREIKSGLDYIERVKQLELSNISHEEWENYVKIQLIDHKAQDYMGHLKYGEINDLEYLSQDRKKEQVLAKYLYSLSEHGTCCYLDMPEGKYVLNKRELITNVKNACKKVGLSYGQSEEHIGSQTGSGYGNYTSYYATKGSDLIAVTGAYEGEFFSKSNIVKIHSPKLKLEDCRSISPDISSIAEIEDSNLRKFIAAFYEVWQGEK